jgi:hypothetical protein
MRQISGGDSDKARPDESAGGTFPSKIFHSPNMPADSPVFQPDTLPQLN